MIAIPLFLRVGAFGALFSSVAIFSSGGVDKFNLKIQRTIMRIVRDMSRHKARKKMDAEQQYGLVPFLLFSGGDISNSQVLDDLLQNFDTFDIISREELSLAKGGQIEESSCIDNKNVSSTCDSSLQSDLWISILGHVFDVKVNLWSTNFLFLFEIRHIIIIYLHNFIILNCSNRLVPNSMVKVDPMKC